jgi:dTDP-4-dehydrorhamnose 3,5-epimerase
MEIERCAIPDVLVVKPRKFGDHRGFFSEVFKSSVLNDAGVHLDWIQDNHSFSAQRGVVRGLHFQTSPHAQAKLLRVVRGSILDVAVDIRTGSPTYGQHVAVELSADNWKQLMVPVGFAHGFMTLTEDAEVLYKVTGRYAPECEGGLMWNDPDLAISWPIEAQQAILSARDLEWPAFREFSSPF